MRWFAFVNVTSFVSLRPPPWPSTKISSWPAACPTSFAASACLRTSLPGKWPLTEGVTVEATRIRAVSEVTLPARSVIVTATVNVPSLL